MNILGSNALALLSGAEGVGNVQKVLQGATGDQAGFAAALMQQIGLLQSEESHDLGAIQSLMDDPAMGESLQNLAALVGQQLPAGDKSAQDIDLEDTLKTLADVMQQLQQLDAGTSSSMAQEHALAAELKDQESEAALESAAMAAMPVTVPPSPELAAEQATEAVEASGIMTDAKKPAALQSQDAKPQSAAAAAIAKPDELGVEFDRSISALLAKDAVDDKLPADKSALDLKASAVLEDVKTVVDEQTGKPVTPNSIAGDIARMAGAVRNEATVTLPANQTTLQKHYADPGWQQELGDKLVWMHKQNMPSVELRLNPEHLGPVLVKIDVSHDQATVAFTAQHLAVKEAIEAAIPKLREMLGNQQLNLTDVNVSQQQSEQRQSAREFFQMAGEQGQRRANNEDGLGLVVVNEAQDIVDEIEAGRAIASNGLLSLFA